MVMRILKQWDKLTVLDGILYRVTRDPVTKHKRFQFVLPDSLKSQALAGVHDLAGHQGQPRALSLVRQRFFWYDVEKDVRSYVRNCARNVLRDDCVCDYNAYVKSLATDLQSAMLLAQRHSSVEQKHQSDQYNKKVKGLPLAVEDDLRSVDTVSHDPSNVPDPEAAVSEPESVAEHSVVDSSSWLNVASNGTARPLLSSSLPPPPQDCHISERVMDLAFPCLYFLLLGPALLLNVVAAWISLRIPTKSTFMVYLKNLIATDLLATAMLPFKAASDLPGVPTSLRAFACRYSDVLFYFSMNVSILLLGLISLDRFFKIVRPFGRLPGQGLAFGAGMCASVWVLLFSATVVPTMVLTDREPTNKTGDNCMALKGPAGLDFHIGVIVANQILFFGVCALTVVCYTCIAHRVLRSYRDSRSSNERGRREAKARVFIVLAVFLVCFVPYHVVRVPYTRLQTSGENSCRRASLRVAKKAFLWLATTNICLDPLIYIFLCRAFRERLLEVWRSLLVVLQQYTAR
ncbi:hypothetical protein AAFF_G00248250 [Aldrovandia affinis]|uniref:Gypsy retrotransposon integrase-like protein 1 n=1 Tax=Aldrovandia affinis TaxID=143900 RepID=A0AAD7W3H7_9TELE|nr:hypothetical protein AAFF_G00248250 [Aldrovandia affinis]